MVQNSEQINQIQNAYVQTNCESAQSSDVTSYHDATLHPSCSLLLETLSLENESSVSIPTIPSNTTRPLPLNPLFQDIPRSNRDEQNLTPVAFSDIARTPIITSTSKPGQTKRKRHASLLTASPLKSEKKKITKRKQTKIILSGFINVRGNSAK